jgi:hypothetical protein
LSVSEREDAVTAPENPAGVSSRRRSYTELLRDRRIGPGAVVAIAALIGLIVWLVVESGGGDSSTSKTTTTNANPPVALSASGLDTLAKAAPQPIYWIGERPDTMYELTQTPSRVYLRYLPAAAKAGDSRPFLTVGTYAMQNAYNVMKSSAESSDAELLDVPGGGVATVNKGHPTSVYVAYPDSNYQVEVYSPSAATARELALSGRVQPVVETRQYAEQRFRRPSRATTSARSPRSSVTRSTGPARAPPRRTSSRKRSAAARMSVTFRRACRSERRRRT